MEPGAVHFGHWREPFCARLYPQCSQTNLSTPNSSSHGGQQARRSYVQNRGRDQVREVQEVREANGRLVRTNISTSPPHGVQSRKRDCQAHQPAAGEGPVDDRGLQPRCLRRRLRRLWSSALTWACLGVGQLDWRRGGEQQQPNWSWPCRRK